VEDKTDLTELHQRYLATRSDADRDALVEAWFPWVKNTALLIAHRLGIIDRDQAVSLASEAFTFQVLPKHRRIYGLKRWAYLVFYRRLTDWKRQESGFRLKHKPPVVATGSPDDGEPEVCRVPAPTPKTCEMCDHLTCLPPSLAVVMWLRFRCGMTERDIAKSMRVSQGTVRNWVESAMESIVAAL
jgi:DNA-directed RNA polymerase specialized sigma24 family protein